MEEQEEGLGPIAIPEKRADEAKLGSLHGVVAEYLTLVISSGNCPPALIGAAITFLKNNSITADAATNTKLSALKETLAGKQRRGGGLTKPAMQEAHDAFADLMGNMGLPQ
jgi:hypothetical protein